MKIIISEFQLKKLIKEQDSWTTKAASGPQKCGLDGSSDGSGSVDRQWDRDIKKQDKIDAKQTQKEFQDYLNPKVDRLGYKINTKDFNLKYGEFVKSNPDFETLSSTLSPAQRFGILYKESQALKSPVYYLTTKLNAMFNHKGEIDMQEFYNMIKQMGGFDKYIEYYKKGFPSK